MTERQNKIWERFLSPVVSLLIDEEGLQRYALSVDWEKQSDRFQRADVTIPAYYNNHKFRGIEGGYLNPQAVVTYDPLTQYLLPPHESLVRQALIDTIKVQPRRILDLGCGTGSATLMLKRAFPQAEVIGLDLSPYMLVRAEYKAISANLNILWRHGNAEKTAFPASSFDLVTASLLFHEVPAAISQSILQESFRLLTVGGQVLILDSSQNAWRHLEWAKDVFVEPYLHEYAAGNIDESMKKVGFAAVQNQDIWWIHQITSGIKPIPTNARHYVPTSTDTIIDHNGLEGLGSPAFGIRRA
ncbi:class I SAM-dependent methyltransferase [Fortiea contorta]|uniref:class I SAM-dependent methyltransferase n=1 Tax=Fortiea contorta TaxID=1892405 RepID=UPI00034492AD|nr:class I SAM-dependent methyltransferase [Fortiea contorta]